MTRNKTLPIVKAIFIVSLFVTTAFAEVWTSSLGGNSITSMAFDKKRNLMWFTTEQNGAFSFDGTSFTPYNVITTDNGLVSNSLTSVAIDFDYELWFGSIDDGISRFNPDANQWTHYKKSDGLASHKIKSLAVDVIGYIWIATADSGATRFDRKGGWIKYDQGLTREGKGGNSVLAIAIDKMNNKWFGLSQRGVAVLSESTGDDPWCYYLDNEIVESMLIESTDTSEVKWFGTGNGVFKLAGSELNCAEQPVKLSLLPTGTVRAIFADQEGNKWFGLGLGAIRLGRSEDYFRTFEEETNLGKNIVTAITSDGEGNLWFGTAFQKGATRYSSNWNTFTTKDGLLSNFIGVLKEDTNGDIWAGNGLLGLARLDGTRWQNHLFFSSCPEQSFITAIDFDEDTGIWLGTKTCGVMNILPDSSFDNPIIYTTDEGLTHNVINDIAIFEGEIWLATENGLSVRRPGVDVWDSLNTSNSNLINNRVKTIAIDGRGIIWCGTTEGASRFDKIEWKNFTEKNGLAGNWINDIAIDDSSNKVWFATAGAGVSCYDVVNNRWQTFDVGDGLANNFVNSIAIVPDSSAVWFGTANGASYLDDSGTLTTYTAQHGLGENFVTSLLLDSQGRMWFGSTLQGVTRYKRRTNRPVIRLLNRFDITTSTDVLYNFIGADHGTPNELLRYSYKLDDNPYSPPTFDTFARVRIPSDTLHTFFVKTIDSDGNEDMASDTFYKIPVDRGQKTAFIFPISAISSEVIRQDSVAVEITWPPYLFKRGDAADIRVKAVAFDSLDSLTLFAFDLNLEESGVSLLDTLDKPATLSVSFPRNERTMRMPLSIYRQFPDGARLGGTLQTKGDTVRITTAIRAPGRYTVQAEVQDPPQEMAKINAQPRIFSPEGGGHGRETTLSFTLAEPSHVRIRVYNLAGRLVDTICDEPLNAGVNAIAWNGADRDGKTCPTGLYIFTLESNMLNATHKVMVLNK